MTHLMLMALLKPPIKLTLKPQSLTLKLIPKATQPQIERLIMFMAHIQILRFRIMHQQARINEMALIMLLLLLLE